MLSLCSNPSIYLNIVLELSLGYIIQDIVSCSAILEAHFDFIDVCREKNARLHKILDI